MTKATPTRKLCSRNSSVSSAILATTTFTAKSRGPIVKVKVEFRRTSIDKVNAIYLWQCIAGTSARQLSRRSVRKILATLRLKLWLTRNMVLWLNVDVIWRFKNEKNWKPMEQLQVGILTSRQNWWLILVERLTIWERKSTNSIPTSPNMILNKTLIWDVVFCLTSCQISLFIFDIFNCCSGFLTVFCLL